MKTVLILRFTGAASNSLGQKIILFYFIPFEALEINLMGNLYAYVSVPLLYNAYGRYMISNTCFHKALCVTWMEYRKI